MNIIEIIDAMRDGSAQGADVKALVDELHRVFVRSRDNGAVEARELLRIAEEKIAGGERRSFDLQVGQFCIVNLAVVARLEAEKQAFASALVRAEAALERKTAELARVRPSDDDLAADAATTVARIVDVASNDDAVKTLVCRAQHILETKMAESRREWDRLIIAYLVGRLGQWPEGAT